MRRGNRIVLDCSSGRGFPDIKSALEIGMVSLVLAK